jgi:hypothetical protein
VRRCHQIVGVDLTQIHGLDPYLALKLVGECGTDLSAWPTARHFTSRLCRRRATRSPLARCFRPRRTVPAIGRPFAWRWSRWDVPRRPWELFIAVRPDVSPRRQPSGIYGARRIHIDLAAKGIRVDRPADVGCRSVWPGASSSPPRATAATVRRRTSSTAN